MPSKSGGTPTGNSLGQRPDRSVLNFGRLLALLAQGVMFTPNGLAKAGPCLANEMPIGTVFELAACRLVVGTS